eukprot:5622031-Pyramimonas_sp.AAC.1
MLRVRVVTLAHNPPLLRARAVPALTHILRIAYAALTPILRRSYTHLTPLLRARAVPALTHTLRIAYAALTPLLRRSYALE